MNFKNIMTYEKQLIKGLITMYRVKEIELIPKDIANDLYDIVDNGNTDHWYELCDYIEAQIAK
jgi:hypothetical protein